MFQEVSLPGFNVYSSCDTVACLVSVGELVWFSMCTLLVTVTVTCLVSEGELAWI
jgi:hypothetical protein